MSRRGKEKLVIETLRAKGPLTDGELARWAEALGLKGSTAKRIRGRLAKAGVVRFARRFRLTERNRWGQLWELAPAG